MRSELVLTDKESVNALPVIISNNPREQVGAEYVSKTVFTLELFFRKYCSSLKIINNVLFINKVVYLLLSEFF